VERLTALADDELVLAHRDSEWTGHAPILEEDIALANLAQDELGHAGLWFGLRHALDGSDTDALVFFRDAPAYRNVQLVELPKGDWAFTMLRQYLFDAYESVLLARLEGSRYTPLAEAAQKVRREERFHLQHTHAWVERLGLGTQESNERMQRALETLWSYAQQLFVPLPGDVVLVPEGIVPDAEALRAEWQGVVLPHLEASNLRVPASAEPPARSREVHTDNLAELLAEMQAVARLEPAATGIW
jgi:ring-1,2-phenylacetyl-CoA epoxidase subunit PaaC